MTLVKCRYCNEYRKIKGINKHERTHKEYVSKYDGMTSSEWHKIYYNLNKEKIREYKKKYHQTKEFKEKNRIKSIEYRNKNKEKVDGWKRDWRLSERGRKILAWLQGRRRVKLKNIVEKYTIDEWKNKLKKTKGICPACKKNVGINNLTIDHIYSISMAKKGRIYTINDIQPLCISCNSIKSNKEVIKYEI